MSTCRYCLTSNLLWRNTSYIGHRGEPRIGWRLYGPDGVSLHSCQAAIDFYRGITTMAHFVSHHEAQERTRSEQQEREAIMAEARRRHARRHPERKSA